MGHFISGFFLLQFLAIGVLSIYFLVDFFEYMKRYHAFKWKELSYEQPFGIPQKDFYFYPIRPFKFIPFLISTDDMDDTNVATYKTRIKLSILVIMGMFVSYSFFLII